MNIEAGKTYTTSGGARAFVEKKVVTEWGETTWVGQVRLPGQRPFFQDWTAEGHVYDGAYPEWNIQGEITTMTKLVNLTPHAIRIRLSAETVAEPLETDIVVEPTQPPCRIAQSSMPVQPIAITSDDADVKIFREVEIPVKKAVFGQIENLPEPEVGVVYIVSLPVAQNAHRADVVSPDTSPAGGAVRVANGQIFAVRGFQQFD